MMTGPAVCGGEGGEEEGSRKPGGTQRGIRKHPPSSWRRERCDSEARGLEVLSRPVQLSSISSTDGLSLPGPGRAAGPGRAGSTWARGCGQRGPPRPGHQEAGGGEAAQRCRGPGLPAQCALPIDLPAAALASGYANVNAPVAVPPRGGARAGEFAPPLPPPRPVLGRLPRAGDRLPGFVLTLSLPQEPGQGTLCRSCPPGTFSAAWGSSPCQSHSRCSLRGRLEARAGTVTQDTLCGGCQPG